MRVRFFNLVACLALVCVPVQAADLLTVGSEMPQLDVEHWIQDGDGKFSPVTKFERGKVYVIEFWATWCGPCVQSMPHLANLQKRFEKQELQIVSVSAEDLETVEAFLNRPIRGEVPGEDESGGPATYRQLTSAYCLTTDPDGSTNQDYMEAAARGGIPNAFIVGKDGKIEWIGHPLEMDVPLESVVNDRWDRKAYIEQLKRQEEAERLLAISNVRFLQDDYSGALEMLDKALELVDDPQLRIPRLGLLIRLEKFDAAEAYLKSLLDSSSGAGSTNGITWAVFMMSNDGHLPGNRLVPTAIDAARKVLETASRTERASLLDTLGHLQFVSGNLDQALNLQQRAVDQANGSAKREYQEFLDELKKAKEEEQQ